MTTNVKRDKDSHSATSNPLTTPDPRVIKSTDTAQSSLAEIPRRHSNPELKPGQVSVGEIAPNITPSKEKKAPSNVDYIFKQTQTYLSAFNSTLSTFVTPQHTSKDDGTLQSCERAFLHHAKDLDDPESLFSPEQKAELFKQLEEGFKLLRAAFIKKYPQIDKEKVNEITQPRLEAIKSKLDALEKQNPSGAPHIDPFPNDLLIPDPDVKNALFPEGAPTYHLPPFYIKLFELLTQVNKYLEEEAINKTHAYIYGSKINSTEQALIDCVNQLSNPHSPLSSTLKISLCTEVLKGFKSLYQIVITTRPAIPKTRLDSIHNARERAIQLRISALKNPDVSSSNFPPFPTESLLPTPTPSPTTSLFWLAIAVLISAGIAFAAHRRMYTKIST